ncbi:hypothetical protein QBC37DRAFT_402917 [Rhypophila decipiens]|uniref:Uncharacterized protein n=1 Tax=Rhypophila decipiens TaxID=261697 RepID=A0AAN7B4T3_9PEZI|nr:hypothetical protein QBC37DRAFT_402917 [Rhypophila decipiens]
MGGRDPCPAAPQIYPFLRTMNRIPGIIGISGSSSARLYELPWGYCIRSYLPTSQMIHAVVLLSARSFLEKYALSRHQYLPVSNTEKKQKENHIMFSQRTRRQAVKLGPAKLVISLLPYRYMLRLKFGVVCTYGYLERLVETDGIRRPAAARRWRQEEKEQPARYGTDSGLELKHRGGAEAGRHAQSLMYRSSSVKAEGTEGQVRVYAVWGIEEVNLETGKLIAELSVRATHRQEFIPSVLDTEKITVPVTLTCHSSQSVRPGGRSKLLNLL